MRYTAYPNIRPIQLVSAVAAAGSMHATVELRMKKIAGLIAVALACVTGSPRVEAATKTWDGGHGSINSWYANLNWNPDNAPVDDDDLVFAGTSDLTNYPFPDGLDVAGITFDNTAGAFVMSNLHNVTLDLEGDITNNSTSLQTLNVRLKLQGGNRAIDTSAGDVAIGGIISQDGSNRKITQVGSNTLTLTAANTYAGGTSIGSLGGDLAGGTIIITDGAALGSGLVTFEQGGALELGASGLTVANALFVPNWSGTPHTVRLDETGASTGTLSGDVRIHDGTGSGFQVDVGTDDTLTMSGKFFRWAGGGAGITKVGAGTLILTGDSANPPAGNNLVGNIKVNVGTVQLGNGGTAGTTAAGRSIQISAGATFAVNQSDTVTQGTDFSSSAISGAGGFAQAGSGTTVLNAANTYSGNTTISAGTLEIGGSGTLGSGGVYASDISNSGTLKCNSTADQELSGTLSGAGILNKLNSSTLTLSGAGNTAATMSAAGGNLVLSGSSTTTVSNWTYVANSGISGGGSGTLTVQDTATLTSNGLLVGNNNSRNGTLNQTGGAVNLNGSGANDVRVGHWSNLTGTYTLSGGTLNVPNTTFTAGWDGHGVLNVNGGTANLQGIRFGYGNNGARAGTLTLGGGTLNIGSSGMVQEINGTINLNSGTLGALADWSTSLGMTLGGSVDVDTTGGDITLTGALAGAGILRKIGTGTLVIPTHNTHTGTLTVSAGTLEIRKVLTGHQFPATSTYNINNGATLEVTRAAGNILFYSSKSWNFDSNGGGTLYLNTSAIGPSAFFLNGTNTVTTNGGSENTIGGPDSIGSQSGTHTFNVAAGPDDSDLTVTAVIGSDASIVKSGAGTMTLSATNTYSGTTTVSAGALVVTGATGSGDVSVATGATLKGTGTIGGDVTVSSGGILSPGL